MDTPKQMPDLMGTAHATPGNADGNRRILAHLEHGPRAQARPARAWNVDGWTVGLVLLLLTMCGVAWLMHEETITPVTFKSQRSSKPEVTAAPAPQQSRQAEPQAAALINTPHLAPLPPPTPTPVQVTESRDIVPRSIADQGASHKRASTPRLKPVIDMVQEKPASHGDTDVTLLTALVAHAGQPASVAPEIGRAHV